jgi:hypothetical protein
MLFKPAELACASICIPVDPRDTHLAAGGRSSITGNTLTTRILPQEAGPQLSVARPPALLFNAGPAAPRERQP